MVSVIESRTYPKKIDTLLTFAVYQCPSFCLGFPFNLPQANPRPVVSFIDSFISHCVTIGGGCTTL